MRNLTIAVALSSMSFFVAGVLVGVDLPKHRHDAIVITGAILIVVLVITTIAFTFRYTQQNPEDL